MLTQVPNEIVLHVLSYLSKSDLLACMAVSHSLYRLVVPILYKSVSLSDISRIGQGLRCLCDNPAIAQHVHSVKFRIERGCDNVDKLSLIPHVLTHLRELHINADYELNDTNTQIESTVCQPTLQDLSIRERGVSFVAALLGSGTFNSLTYLSISFLQNFWNNNAIMTPHQSMIDMGQRIISCFVNTPALTALNIRHAKFTLTDLETLHNHLPELRELTLINTCFPSNTTGVAAIKPDIRPLVKLKLLHLTLRPARPDIGKVAMQREISRNVLDWLTYIERKYTKLTSFTMELTDSDANEFDLPKLVRFDTYNAAKDQMEEIVRKLNDIEKVETQLLPFNESSIRFCNKHQLNAVKLFDYELDIETQMKYLHDSKQKESIRSLSLALNNPDFYDNIDALQHIFTLYQFDQITMIDIKSTLGEDLYGLEYRFSLYLLQYVPSLEVLKIWSIQVNDSRIPTLAPNRLKSLDIFRFHIVQNWSASNTYLQTILQASPFLETFKTTLKIGYRDHQYRFILDLTGNKYLKSVCLEYFDRDTCLLLENDPKRTDKYWKTITTSIKKPAFVSRYALIDLRWNETTKVDAYPVPPPGHR